MSTLSIAQQLDIATKVIKVFNTTHRKGQLAAAGSYHDLAKKQLSCDVFRDVSEAYLKMGVRINDKPKYRCSWTGKPEKVEPTIDISWMTRPVTKQSLTDYKRREATALTGDSLAGTSPLSQICATGSALIGRPVF